MNVIEFLFYAKYLLLLEILVYPLIRLADGYFKFKKFKLIKCSKIMLKAKYGNKDEISKVMYWFQIFNYIYIFTYLLNAAIIAFYYNSALLNSITIYSIIAYFIVVIIAILIFGFLAILNGL